MINYDSTKVPLFAMNILEQIPYPIVIHENGYIVEVNTAAVKLSGYESKSETLGLNIMSFLTEESQIKAAQYMASDVEYGNEVYELIDHRNRHHDVEIKKSIFVEEEHKYSFLIMKDISEERRDLINAARVQKNAMDTDVNLEPFISRDIGFYPKDIVSGDFYYITSCEESVCNSETCNVGLNVDECKRHCIIGMLGDVKGKGMSAALTTSAMKILFYDAIGQSNNTNILASRMNKGILRLLGEEFVAAIIFRIDLNHDLISITGAGISEFIYKDSEGKVSIEEIKGPFLGMFEEEMFETKQYSFKKGCEMIFYSDGFELCGIENQLNEFIKAKDFNGRMNIMKQMCKEKVEDDRTWVAFNME